MIMMLLLLAVATLLLSYANGANDNFKAVATIYGSSTLSYRNSLILATIAQILGSLASVVVAGALLAAFSGKGLVDGAVLADERFMIAVALGAGLAVLLATRMGLPISTTHALIGGLAGAGLALSSGSASGGGVAWARLATVFFLPLLVSPLLATVLAGTIYPVARFARKRCGIDEVTCLCVGETIEPVARNADGSLVMAKTGLMLTVNQTEQCQRQYTGTVFGISAQKTVDTMHIFSAMSLGFARGLNDTPKVLALLLAAASFGVNTKLGLIVVAGVMAVGGLMHSRRIAITMGQRITEMNRGQGFIANIVSSSLVIGASLMGTPVSTTHVSTGAIFGIGMWTKNAHGKVVGQILLAWVVTLPIAGILAYVLGTTLKMF